ncbi:Calcium-dependent lipid-binding (CaLB domain) family protein [Forsythia ovata]|uniref:Calcium-dependent lipid-binding (CaLB domain) family protein n=1 Tax=Forsythia ovata TaxID=205694 RepID=A0ABD1QSQ8_9LAMI
MEEETQILEINLISAQGLKTVSTNLRRMQAYAIAWVDPSAKLRTQVDRLGGENPTWNDKFLFRVPKDFISGDTSAVSVEIFAIGYLRDFLIGTVRFLLSTCVSAAETLTGTPAFTAVQIRRPSGRFHGVLNIAAAVYDLSDFAILNKTPAVSFRDMMGKEKRESKPRRGKISRDGSKRSEQSSGGESCELSSLDLSDGADSTTSSSSAASTALKEWNCVRELAGKKKSSKSDGGGMLCGLMIQRKIPFCPSDQNLQFWADAFEEN